MERSQKPLRHSETKAAGTALGGGTRVRGSRPVWTSSSQLPRKAASPAADQSTAAAGSFGGEVAEAGGEQLVDGDGAGQGALAELVSVRRRAASMIVCGSEIGCMAWEVNALASVASATRPWPSSLETSVAARAGSDSIRAVARTWALTRA